MPAHNQIRAIAAFLLDAQARNLAPRTIQFYETEIDRFFAWLVAQGAPTLERVTADHLRAYIVAEQQRGMAPATVAASMRALLRFFNFCVEDGHLPTSPAARVRMPRVPEEIKPALTVTEIRRLLSACTTPRDKAIILCLLDTGCRAGEFLAWTVDDIDLRTGAVLLRKTKARKERQVYLGAQSRRALLRWLAVHPWGDLPTAPIWLATDRASHLWAQGALTRNGLHQLLTRLGDRAGVEQCNPHKFRRTFAIMALRSGMNIYELQRLMGHASLEMVRQYLPLSDADLEGAHRRAGVVDSLL